MRLCRRSDAEHSVCNMYQILRPGKCIHSFGHSFQQITNAAQERLSPLSDQILCTERLHQLVNDLLDISRIESGRIELDVQVVSLAEIITKSANLVRNQFAERELTLDLELPPDLPPQ